MTGVAVSRRAAWSTGSGGASSGRDPTCVTGGADGRDDVWRSSGGISVVEVRKLRLEKYVASAIELSSEHRNTVSQRFEAV